MFAGCLVDYLGGRYNEKGREREGVISDQLLGICYSSDLGVFIYVGNYYSQ